jgi:hypothetical protein
MLHTRSSMTFFLFRASALHVMSSFETLIILKVIICMNTEYRSRFEYIMCNRTHKTCS